MLRQSSLLSRHFLIMEGDNVKPTAPTWFTNVDGIVLLATAAFRSKSLPCLKGTTV